MFQFSDADPPARQAAARSMDAVTRRDKAAWLDLFAADAVVEDPVGPSLFDPEGKGHHGREGIDAFWDKTVGLTEAMSFDIRDSFAAGDEVANVGTITAFLPGGMRVDTEGVFVYRVDEQGLIRSLRAFWETERAMGTMRAVDEQPSG